MNNPTYEEAVEFQKNWKAPKCENPDCICNLTREQVQNELPKKEIDKTTKTFKHSPTLSGAR